MHDDIAASVKFFYINLSTKMTCFILKLKFSISGIGEGNLVTEEAQLW